MVESSWNLLTFSVYIISLGIDSIGAVCHEDQRRQCQTAIEEDRLEFFDNGGTCSKRRYAEFTHDCLVKGYVPSVDFCCCKHEAAALCCKYHQGWEQFRCINSEDVVQVNSSHTIPLQVWLPALLVPLAVVVCCLLSALTIRKARRRKNYEDDPCQFLVSYFNSSKKDSKTVAGGATRRSMQDTGTVYHYAKKETEETRGNFLLNSANVRETDACHPLPSAPPRDEFLSDHIDHLLYQSETIITASDNAVNEGDNRENTPSAPQCAEKTTVGNSGCLPDYHEACPSAAIIGDFHVARPQTGCALCPPPTYDESRDHRLIDTP